MYVLVVLCTKIADGVVFEANRVNYSCMVKCAVSRPVIRCLTKRTRYQLPISTLAVFSILNGSVMACMAKFLKFRLSADIDRLSRSPLAAADDDTLRMRFGIRVVSSIGQVLCFCKTNRACFRAVI